jgi:type I restriction enzyme M protein
VTAAVIKKALKAMIEDLEGSEGDSARKELAALVAHDKAMAKLEKTLKESKSSLSALTEELELKVQLKRLGPDDLKAESQALLDQLEARLAKLVVFDKEGKKELAALERDQAALRLRLSKIDDLFASIGGQLTDAQAKTLVLQKLHELAAQDLVRYLNASKRALVAAMENLWDKYAVSRQTLESNRAKTLEALDGFLKGLGYVK